MPIDGTRRGGLENRGERRAISIVERTSEQRPDGRVMATGFGSRSRGETLLGIRPEPEELEIAGIFLREGAEDSLSILEGPERNGRAAE